MCGMISRVSCFLSVDLGIGGKLEIFFVLGGEFIRVVLYFVSVGFHFSNMIFTRIISPHFVVVLEVMVGLGVDIGCWSRF